MNCRYRRMSGFTLIELLIAMLLASLLALLTYSGLHLGVQSWSISERRLQQLEEHYLTQNLLRRLLESPLQRILRDEEGVLQMAFAGTEQELLFVGSLGPVDPSTALSWIQLSQRRVSEQHPETWQLLLRYLPFDERTTIEWQLLNEQLADTGREELLLDNLEQPLRFDYLEQFRDREAAWQPQWQAREMLPALIRVSSADQAEPVIYLSAAPRELAYGIKVLD